MDYGILLVYFTSVTYFENVSFLSFFLRRQLAFSYSTPYNTTYAT